MRISDPVAWIKTFAYRSDDFFFYSTFEGHNVPARRPLTPDDVGRGLRGTGPSLSILFLRDDNTAMVVAVDADGDDGWAVILSIAGILRRHGIPCAVERSRRGGHLWVACDAPLPAPIIRRAVDVAISLAGLDPADPKIEIRPDCDEKRTQYGGRTLRGPMMPHP